MIGVFGGTFDPIHFGHLRTALDVKQALGLEQVRFIPLNDAVHRGQPKAPAQLRLQMVKAAISGQQGFCVDDREIRRKGPSYTVETLIDLHREWPDQALYLMMGLDAFNHFTEWRRPEEILRLAHLVVMQRPGECLLTPSAKQLLSERRCHGMEQMQGCEAGGVLLQTFTQLDISATQIRNALAQGRSARFWLPDSVLEIIYNKRLYGYV
jgi:nicotinate-nucleotide adenylyltransferase